MSVNVIRYFTANKDSLDSI